MQPTRVAANDLETEQQVLAVDSNSKQNDECKKQQSSSDGGNGDSKLRQQNKYEAL